MVIKGTIQPDHIPLNKFQLLVLGIPVPLTVIKHSGLEVELNTVKLPDRTQASGGNTEPVEFTLTMPMHHKIEQVAMEKWFRDSRDPVAPDYKKTATLVMLSNSGLSVVARQLVGVFPSKRADPELDMENDGELATVVWTMKADDVQPLP